MARHMVAAPNTAPLKNMIVGEGLHGLTTSRLRRPYLQAVRGMVMALGTTLAWATLVVGSRQRRRSRRIMAALGGTWGNQSYRAPPCLLLGRGLLYANQLQ